MKEAHVKFPMVPPMYAVPINTGNPSRVTYVYMLLPKAKFRPINVLIYYESYISYYKQTKTFFNNLFYGNLLLYVYNILTNTGANI